MRLCGLRSFFLSSMGMILEFLIISLPVRLIFSILFQLPIFGEPSFSSDSSKEFKGHTEVVFKCLVEVKVIDGQKLYNLLLYGSCFSG